MKDEHPHERGASLRTGGSAVDGPGAFYAPTVVTDVRPGSDILREEIFGPVLAVATFDEEDEGVALANDTEYGLVAYVYTRDIKRAFRVIEKLETGMIGLNQGMVSNAGAPFGEPRTVCRAPRRKGHDEHDHAPADPHAF